MLLLMTWCLKHQAISIHSADKMFFVLDKFHTTLKSEIMFEINNEIM